MKIMAHNFILILDNQVTVSSIWFQLRFHHFRIIIYNTPRTLWVGWWLKLFVFDLFNILYLLYL